MSHNLDAKIRTYTKVDFFAWLVKNHETDLNSSIISRNRALAQMNNPDANKDDILISVAFIDRKCIGYRGVFPELIDYNNKEIKVAWLTTFFVDENYRGLGIAKKLMEPINNYYVNGIGSIHSSQNALKVYSKLGWDISFLNQTVLSYRIPKPKNYNSNTIVKLVILPVRPIFNFFIEFYQMAWLRFSHKVKYELEYIDLIDDSLYEFIKLYSHEDRFIKNKDKLNWVLKYNWASRTPCIWRVKDNYYFKNNIRDFVQLGVKVKLYEKTIGFYILRREGGNLTVPYLYYNSLYKDFVFRSILEHVVELKASSLTSFRKELIDYSKRNYLFCFFIKNYNISYSCTNQDYLRKGRHMIQDGDGDLFF